MKELSRRLIKLYVLALSLVAIFSIISQVLIQVSITDQQSDSRVVNIAGRQRMLSQRLCKTAILLTNPEIYMPDAEMYVEDIGEILKLWHKCHNGLKDGRLELETNIPVKNSFILDTMWQNIDPYFQNIYKSAVVIKEEVESPTLEKKKRMTAALKQMLSNERIFLKMMDKIVFRYDAEAKERIERLKRVELILFGITLFILFLEGIFIFRPTYKHINSTVENLMKSEDELKVLNRQLMETNAELNVAKIELLKATEEKYRLKNQEDKNRSALIIQGQEEERKRMALELHDGIGQMLTGLKLISEKLNENVFASEKDRRTFNDLKQLLHDTIAETRVISFNLMPTVLNDFGVDAALRLLIDQTQKNTQIKFFYDSNCGDGRYNKNIEIAIYRICQEAINNAVKHATATEVNVHLFRKEQYLQLFVSDNGKGFDAKKLKTKTPKNGLTNMQSRAELLNGQFKISSIKDKGTKILAKIPLIYT